MLSEAWFDMESDTIAFDAREQANYDGIRLPSYSFGTH